MKEDIRDLSETIHYLKVLLECGSPYQPEIRNALSHAIELLEWLKEI